MCLLLKNLKTKISFIAMHPNPCLCNFLSIERIFLRNVPKKLCNKGALDSKKPSLLGALLCHSLPSVPAALCCQHWASREFQLLVSLELFIKFIWTFNLYKKKREKKKEKKTFFLCCISHYRLEKDTKTPANHWKLVGVSPGPGCERAQLSGSVCSCVHHVYIGMSDGARDNGPLKCSPLFNCQVLIFLIREFSLASSWGPLFPTREAVIVRRSLALPSAPRQSKGV